MRIPALALAATLLLLPAVAGAQTRPIPPAEGPTLTVSGEGTVSHAPDQATVAFTIVTNSDSAATATTQNNSIFNDIRNKLAPLGLSDSSIKTASFNVNFVPKPTDATQYRPPRTGFVVSRYVVVTINDIPAVGRVVDVAVGAGVTDINGVSFGLRDRRAVYATALAAAMRDADAQAQAIATAAHVTLAGIRSINAGPYYAPPPMPAPMARMAAGVAAPQIQTEIPPSSIDVRGTLTVTYYLSK